MTTLPLSESDIQIQIVDYLSHLAAVRKDFIFFSVPNEGFLKGVALIAGRESKSALTHATLGRLKKQGMTDGIPDLCIVRKGGGVYFLEVKKPGGELSADQKRIHSRMRDLGIPVAVVRSVDGVMRILGEWGI